MTRPSNITRIRTRRGSILVFVLIVVAVTTALAFGFAYRTRTEMALVDNYANRTRAHYLALGGLERLLCLIEEEKADLTPACHVGALCAFRTTAEAEELFKNVTQRDNAGYQLHVAVHDEEGRLNINRSDPGCWQRLGMLPKDRVCCILDWLDEDDDAQTDGAETSFYEKQTPPYRAKNAPPLVVRELLNVRGITPTLYAGRPETSGGGDGGRGGSALGDSSDDDTSLGLIDIFTALGPGQININTAPAHILEVLPGLDTAVADAIVAFRQGPDGRSGTDDDVFFETLEDIGKVPGLTEMQVELLGQYCCFTSSHLRLDSYARLKGGIDCRLVGIATFQDGKAQLVHVERLP